MTVLGQASTGAQPAESPAGLALEGLAYGIEPLDAIFVLHAGSGQLYAGWVRPGAGVRAEDIAEGMFDAFRASQRAMRKLFSEPPRWGERVPDPDLFVTLEMPARTAMMRRTRAFAVGCLFDASMPLGMARLVTMRMAATLEPDLPVEASSVEAAAPAAEVQVPLPFQPFQPAEAERGEDGDREGDRAREGSEQRKTLEFPSIGAAIVHKSMMQPPVAARATPAEVDRVRRILALLESRAPEPHVIRLRIALRAGLTPLALSSPETLGPNTLVLIETAAEDVLGLDLSDLGSIA